MDKPYVAHRIDQATIELLPSGELLIWQAGQRPIVLEAHVAYALYLFIRLPGVRPALRRLDDERQRAAWETRPAG